MSVGDVISIHFSFVPVYCVFFDGVFDFFGSGTLLVLRQVGEIPFPACVFGSFSMCNFFSVRFQADRYLVRSYTIVIIAVLPGLAPGDIDSLDFIFVPDVGQIKTAGFQSIIVLVIVTFRIFFCDLVVSVCAGAVIGILLIFVFTEIKNIRPGILALEVLFFQFDRLPAELIAFLILDMDRQGIRTIFFLIVLPGFGDLDEVIVVRISLDLDVNDIGHQPPHIQDTSPAEIIDLVHGNVLGFFLGNTRECIKIDQVFRICYTADSRYRLGWDTDEILQWII